MTPPARRLACLLALSAAALALAGADRTQLRSTFTLTGDGRLSVELRGLDRATLKAIEDDNPRASQYLRVHTRESPADEKGERPTVLGKYEVDLDASLLRFLSRFPVEPGITYVADAPAAKSSDSPPGAGGDPDVLTSLMVKPVARVRTTRVVRVSPSRDVLPENLLKFYVEFSAPMSRGKAYENLKLLDSSGKPLDLPFLELGEELWDPRGTRFTLLFDPGRIKTGLKPHDELGPVLERGKTFTLLVETGWLDADGEPLTAGFRKTFKVGPPDTSPPDPGTWVLERPAGDSRRPLVVRFPEPLDRAMLGRVLAVADRSGKVVPGKVSVGDDETSWSFIPDGPWRAGRFELLVDQTLEDLAGNSIGRPFEVDVFEKVERRETSQTVKLAFEVAGGE